ncbi:MAG: hypothetical protein JSW03_08160 [Candidatus Eiseniibacteriota bacterium]|nr:MAG: hypothetical protein JSW03_08160 [Candidatus Eisenbacteria bacterium]
MCYPFLMNIHTALDNLLIDLSALCLGRSRFFDRGITSPTFEEHLRSTVLSVPDIEGEGRRELEADTLSGRLDPALHVAQWRGTGYPTVIYHHGGMERPFDYGPFSKNTFGRILFSKKKPVEANLINLRAAFHSDRSRLRRIRSIRELSDFLAMLAVSVKLVEETTCRVKARSQKRVVVAGISLGGWVANLHRTYFNSADVYVPILAGAALGELFLSSIYRRMVARCARMNPEAVRSLLNFEAEFSSVKDNNVFPVLALYDRIVDYDRQRACYGNAPIRVLKKGHATCARAHEALRRHITELLASP